MPAPTQTQAAPFAKGSIIWEKKGPLPVWAWALIILGLILAVTMWRRNRGQAEAQTAATGIDNTALPGTQKAPYIFVVPQVGQQTPTPHNMPKRRPRTPDATTPPPAPPGGGRDNPPATSPPAAGKPWIPNDIDIPANTNLYNFSQEVEAKYQGWNNLGTIFNKVREMVGGNLKWAPAGSFGADPQYGKVPYIASPQRIALWR